MKVKNINSLFDLVRTKMNRKLLIVLWAPNALLIVVSIFPPTFNPGAGGRKLHKGKRPLLDSVRYGKKQTLFTNGIIVYARG